MEPLFTAGSWVLKQPSTAFIIPVIALNAAAFLVRLAKLWKLSRGYFVIKFTVMSSGGTGSVKFEITSGHSKELLKIFHIYKSLQLDK